LTIHFFNFENVYIDTVFISNSGSIKLQQSAKKNVKLLENDA